MSDPITPTLAILASALKIEHLANGAMLRAADRSLEQLTTDPVYEFDGSELRIISESEPGTWVVTDGVACTCKGAKHAICKHRLLFRLLLAREVLLDPLYVRLKVMEQVLPANYGEEPPPPDDTDRIAAFGDGAAFPLNLPDDDWYAA